MNFRKLRIQGFRSHVDTTLDLAPLTVIRGSNAGGKSSIEKAIQLTLTGRTEETSADGKGSGDLIRAGQPKALITLAVEDGGSERILKCALNGSSKPAVAITRPDDPQYAGGSDYLDALALQRDALSCLVNNRHFVDLPEADQKDVLARIILPKTYDWPDWLRPAVNGMGLKVSFLKTPFEVIDTAYDAAFKARTDVTRDLKNFRMPEGNTAEAAKLEEYGKAAAEARAALEEAKKRKYTLETEQRGAVALLKAAEDRLAQARARLSREEQDVDGLEAAILPKAKLAELEKVARNAGKVESADKEIARLQAAIGANKEARKQLEALDEAMDCPTCKQPITGEAMGAIIGPIIQAFNQLSDDMKTAIDARKAFGNPAEAAAAVAAHSKAQVDLKRSQERIQQERTAIRDAEEAIAANMPVRAAENTPAIMELSSQIAALEKDVTFRSDAVAAARQAKELLTRIEVAEAERKELQAKQQTLHKLVDYFGSNGVKADLLAQSIAPFAASMNEVLTKWSYTCTLSIEPYAFAVVFQDEGGGEVPIKLKHLSKSQRYRFSTAFQVALAITTGLRFVICDEADIYDRDGRAGLFEALTAGELDQAIVLGTDERESVPEMPDAAFYMVEDTAAAGMVPTAKVRRLVAAQREAA